MNEPFVIRTAGAADAPAIAALIRKMMTEEMTESGGHRTSADEGEWDRFPGVIRNNLQDENFTYTVAEKQGDGRALIGVCEAKMIRRAFVYHPVLVLHVYSLYVEGPSRRRGIGRSLLEAALAWGRERQCEEAELDVLAKNPAQALYALMDFRALEYKMVRKL